MGSLFRGRCSPQKFEIARKLRKNQTLPEAAVWRLLRKKQLGFRVKRQTVIAGWIVDFWIPAHRLAVEIDGPFHDAEKDAFRDSTLLARGIRTLRFPHTQAVRATAEIVAAIKAACSPGAV
jgi:very-short-patch-repair endonuclease